MSHATERHCTFTRWDHSGAQRTYDLLRDEKHSGWGWSLHWQGGLGSKARSRGQEARRPLRSEGKRDCEVGLKDR